MNKAAIRDDPKLKTKILFFVPGYGETGAEDIAELPEQLKTLQKQEVGDGIS